MFNLRHLQIMRMIPGRRSSSSSRTQFKTKESLIKIGYHGYSLLVIPALTFGLGTWQVFRREWKLSIIENLASRTSAAPIQLPNNLEDLQDMEYRKFELVGTFQNDQEVFIGPRSRVEEKDLPATGGLISSAQSGYNVVTPFKISGTETTVLVNRGWVPRKKMNPATRSDGQIESETKLVGLYRNPEKRAQFVPQHQPRSKMFHYRDVETMARLLNTAPIFFDADKDSSVPDGPFGGQTVVTVRNEHMSYILTWYSLSIITSFLWYRRFIKKLPLM